MSLCSQNSRVANIYVYVYIYAYMYTHIYAYTYIHICLSLWGENSCVTWLMSAMTHVWHDSWVPWLMCDMTHECHEWHDSFIDDLGWELKSLKHICIRIYMCNSLNLLYERVDSFSPKKKFTHQTKKNVSSADFLCFFYTFFLFTQQIFFFFQHTNSNTHPHFVTSSSSFSAILPPVSFFFPLSSLVEVRAWCAVTDTRIENIDW